MLRIRSGGNEVKLYLILFLVFLFLINALFLTLQTFKDHMIDGETLPLLSEEHLLDTLGLKLGPALKIRSQVKDALTLEGEMSCKAQLKSQSHTKKTFAVYKMSFIHLI